MPRPLRRFQSHVPYHIVQRGNHQQNVFDCDNDRLSFLDALKHNLDHYDIRLEGYCLMSNHVHLLVLPFNERRISVACQSLFHRHAVRMNRRRGTTGHLWENRFHAVEFDEASVWVALRYIELNPVKIALVSTPERYPWSSAQAHTDGNDPFGIVDLAHWRQRFSPETLNIWLKAETVHEAALAERMLEGHTHQKNPSAWHQGFSEVADTGGV